MSHRGVAEIAENTGRMRCVSSAISATNYLVILHVGS